MRSPISVFVTTHDTVCDTVGSALASMYVTAAFLGKKEEKAILEYDRFVSSLEKMLTGC